MSSSRKLKTCSGVEFDKKANETAVVLYPPLYNKDAHPFDLGNAEYVDDNYFGSVENFTDSICKTYEEFTKLYIVSSSFIIFSVTKQ